MADTFNKSDQERQSGGRVDYVMRPLLSNRNELAEVIHDVLTGVPDQQAIDGSRDKLRHTFGCRRKREKEPLPVDRVARGSPMNRHVQK